MTSPPASDRPGGVSNSSSPVARVSEASSETLTMARASERLIQRFGGIRPMANKLEVPVTTVQGWKKRGAIPATRLADLRAAAQRHGIPLDEAELEAVGGLDERPAPAAAPEPEPVPVTAPVAASAPTAAADPDPAPVPLSDAEPVPVNVPLAVPPVRPRVAEPVPPFELPPARPSRLVSRHQVSSANTTSAPVPPAAVAAAAARLAAGAVPAASAAGNRLMALGPARLSLAAAVVALIAAGIAVWSSPSSCPAGDEAASATERRLGDLESKVTRVAQEQTTTVEKRLAALDTKLGQTASRKAADELAERVALLEKELPALQQRVSAQGLGSPAVAVLLAATQLRGGLATSNPYVNELAAFRLTGFNDPPLRQSLDQISSRALGGIATEAWLIGRFSTVHGNILRAATLGDPGGRVADFFLDALSDLAPPLYRLTGVPEGASPRAIADRAVASMAAGDFSRAVEQLGELTGLPAEVAAPWLAEARARVIADRARTQLAKHMLAVAQPGTK